LSPLEVGGVSEKYLAFLSEFGRICKGALCKKKDVSVPDLPVVHQLYERRLSDVHAAPKGKRFLRKAETRIYFAPLSGRKSIGIEADFPGAIVRRKLRTSE
jgi:hypothetical protein